MWLEITLRAVGFAVAILGSGAAVPAATWRLLIRLGRRFEGVVRQLLHSPRHVEVHVADVAMASSSGLAVSGVARGEAGGGTVEERLERLERRVRQVDQEQQRTAADLAQERATRMQEHADLRSHVDTEVGRLHARFEDEQRAVEEIDAAALPVVLAGAAIGTFYDLLGGHLVIGLLALAIGIVAGGRAIVLLKRARPSKA